MSADNVHSITRRLGKASQLAAVAVALCEAGEADLRDVADAVETPGRPLRAALVTAAQVTEPSEATWRLCADILRQVFFLRRQGEVRRSS